MNYHELTIFSHNVRKNKTLTDIILETKKANTDVIFIQEPPRFLWRHIPSHTNPEGNPVYEAPLHPNWTLFACYNNNPNDISRVITYINQRCKKLWFTLWNNIIDHHDINVVSFHNGQNLNFIINIYSDHQQQALQALHDAPPSFNNSLLMTGDFNIRDNDWDPSFPHHSQHTDKLLIIADSLGLDLSSPTHQVPTRYANNNNGTNSVLDLVFIPLHNSGFNQHEILPDIRKPSDHVLLIIKIGIQDINNNSIKCTIKKNSDQEKNFIKNIISNTHLLNMEDIHTKEDLEVCVNHLSEIFQTSWDKHSKETRFAKHSKKWWNADCTDSINKYRSNSSIDNWKNFKSIIWKSKIEFFDKKILEIASSNKRPWDLMNWVQKKSLPAIEAISYQGSTCDSLDKL